MIHFREFDGSRFKDLYLEDASIVGLHSHCFPPESLNSDFGTSTKIVTASGQTHLVFGEPSVVRQSIENQGGHTGGHATSGTSNLILELQRRLIQEGETNVRLREALDRKIEECAVLKAQIAASASTSVPPWMAATAPDTETSWLDVVDELVEAEAAPIPVAPKPAPKSPSKPSAKTEQPPSAPSRFALLEVD